MGGGGSSHTDLGLVYLGLFPEKDGRRRRVFSTLTALTSTPRLRSQPYLNTQTNQFLSLQDIGYIPDPSPPLSFDERKDLL